MFGRTLDHFKSDQRLMQEETALFAQVMEADEIEQDGGTPPELPRSLYRSQCHKLKILCERGHVPDSEGGWQS
jgi:hypothetical protein